MELDDAMRKMEAADDAKIETDDDGEWLKIPWRDEWVEARDKIMKVVEREFDCKLFENEEEYSFFIDPSKDTDAPENGVLAFDLWKMTFESVAFSFVMGSVLLKYGDPGLEEKLVEKNIDCDLMFPY